jgi:hypothetical protein
VVLETRGWSEPDSVAYTLCGWVTSGSLVPGGRRGAGYREEPTVRLLEESSRNRGVAQLAEQRSPKPQVAGSSPVAPALDATMFDTTPVWT